jgi:hypothetical protein
MNNELTEEPKLYDTNTITITSSFTIDNEYIYSFAYNAFKYLIKYHELSLDNNHMIIFTKDFTFVNVQKESLLTWWIITILNYNNTISKYIKQYNIDVYIKTYGISFEIDITLNSEISLCKHILDFSPIFQEYKNACGNINVHEIIKNSHILAKFIKMIYTSSILTIKKLEKSHKSQTIQQMQKIQKEFKQS